ncbi:MAG TPA: hypothetical protein VH188_01415, partial [Chthoniobacterales bacterium]|nr:hypothetical protein [Chthoniobacterales bacterium]
YTDLVSTTDPVSNLVDVTYYGLETNLSDVLKAAPAGGAHSVAIFADTLVLDVAAITTSGLLIVARILDVSGLNGQALVVTPGADGQVLAQIAAGGVTGGSFTLAVAGQESAAVTPPAGTSPLTATAYVASKGTGFTTVASTGDYTLEGLIASAWMINSLQATFSAAAWLMDDSAADLSTVAQAMLAWVVGCTAILATNNNLPSDYSQLYNQAAALLLTLNVAPGATFVPILSATYYSQHMSDVITVIRDYEANAATLDTRQDVAQAIATVSATLQSVADVETAPLKVQLDGITANTTSLYSDITDLRSKFTLQTQAAHTAFLVMSDEIATDNIRRQLAAELDLLTNVVVGGFDAAQADQGDVGGAVQSGVDAIKDLIAAINANAGTGDDLSTQATDLLTTQMAMMQTVLNARLLYQQALENESGGVLPVSLSAITLDPVTDWDNYIAAAEAEISGVQRGLGDDAQAAADSYLASLKILAGYGKAIGGKFVAYVAQLVQATVVMAQIEAAKDVEQRWADAQAHANSDAEKLAALKALIQGRLQAMKRSLYVAWTYYAASYFYLNFQSPPRALHLSMNAAELESALVGVSDWVAQAIGNAPDGQHVQLPNNDAEIELDFAILQPNTTVVITGDAAQLSKAKNGDWSLTFTVPLGTSQLEGVLPNNGKCAVWISQAAFFLDGVTPNSKGNVIASVSTSGTYQNGIGGSSSYTFVTKGLTGDYAYHSPDNTIYSPWKINTAVYMTPTPYTQWSITLASGSGDPTTATKLRVKLTIAYLS